jgi:hypothetical protein
LWWFWFEKKGEKAKGEWKERKYKIKLYYCYVKRKERR